jgi:hypothetical protein
VEPVIEEGRPAETPTEGQDAPPPGVEGTEDEEAEAEGPLTQKGNKAPAAGTTSATSASGSNSQPETSRLSGPGGAPVGGQMPVFPWSIKR